MKKKEEKLIESWFRENIDGRRIEKEKKEVNLFLLITRRTVAEFNTIKRRIIL